MEGAKDEVAAHIGLFKREGNQGYDRMVGDAAGLVVDWFNDETEIYDDPKFAEPAPAEAEETEAIAMAVDTEGMARVEEDRVKESREGPQQDTEVAMDDDTLPDESPIDIAAAASLVPLPDDTDQDLPEEGGKAEQKQAYLRHLFGIAQQTGTSLRSYLPSKLSMAEVPKVSMPMVALPSMPTIPRMPAMPSIPMPTRMNPFSGKPTAEAEKVVEVTSDAQGQAASHEKRSGQQKDDAFLAPHGPYYPGEAEPNSRHAQGEEVHTQPEDTH